LELHQRVIALRGYCVANLQTDAMILYLDQHQISCIFVGG